MLTRRRIDLPTLRAAAWTVRALRQVRKSLARDGLDGTQVKPPPRLPASARRGVIAAMRRRETTCLERALVLQRWEAAHGAPSDVIIAVGKPTDEFGAHAWLESLPDGDVDAYAELMRLPAPVR
jgi:hypothetical protein